MAKRNMLSRKLWRDLRIDIKSFVAVFIICTLAVTLYLGIDVGWRGMERAVEDQFAVCALSDLWVHATKSDRMARDIAALPGVADAQRRTSIRADVKGFDGDPQLILMESDDTARINKPMLLSGADFSRGDRNTCLINPEFAAAHTLQPGDMLNMTYGPHRLELRIVGIAHSAEYVMFNDAYGASADERTFGYAFVSPGTLGFLPYDQLLVRLDADADLTAVKREVERLLDDPELSVVTRNDLSGIKMAAEEAEQIRALGTVLGVIFGYFGIGKIVVAILTSVYVMPGCRQFLNVPVAAGVCLVMVTIVAGASYLSCRQALKEVPSDLLRPKAPQAGKRALIEKIPFLWNHLSFSNKLILRNLSRNKVRIAIGLVGVIGCTALMLTGFGMRDSVAFVLPNYYGNTMRYDVRVSLVDAPGDNYIAAVAARSRAEHMERAMEGALEIWREGSYELQNFFVYEDHHETVYLRDKDDERVWLSASGVAISEKMSEDTGFRVGDAIHLRAPNGTKGAARVEQIVSVQLGQGIYMSRSAWRHLDLMPYRPTALLLSGSGIDVAALSDMDGIDRVRTITEELDGSASVVAILNVVVVIMVLFAGVLALVVLYTLGQLNFHERQRELATLMVLGFFPRESKRLILRENIITALIGIPIGLLIGPYLHSWVLKSGLPNTLEFIPYIAPTSWIFTPLWAFAFALLVNFMVGAKFKHVDMVESLKSVE